MLNPSVIEEIKRREAEREKEERSRPTVEVPQHGDPAGQRSEQDEPPASDGVVELDLRQNL